MIPITHKIGATVHILVPFNAVHDAAALSDRLRSLNVQNAPAVFIPVNRG